jgi:hypothetical protein
MFWARIMLGLLLIIGMVSCAPQPQVVAQVVMPVSPTYLKTNTPLPKPSITPSPSQTSTRTPTITLTTEPAFHMCSPLPLHPLEELPQIIGDPYKPPPPGREERHHGVDFGYYHYQDRDSMLGEHTANSILREVAAAMKIVTPMETWS